MDDSKNMARALRRHHAARLKTARATYWGRLRGSSALDPLTPRQLGMCLATTALCSGYCCGNPRRWFGELSMQERRHSQREQLGEEHSTSAALPAAQTEKP